MFDLVWQVNINAVMLASFRVGVTFGVYVLC
jgi:hypothetical protein